MMATALFWVGPLAAKFGRIAVQGSHFVGGVVGELHDAELPSIGVEFVHKVGGDLHLAAVEVELLASARWLIVRRQSFAVLLFLLTPALGFVFFVTISSSPIGSPSSSIVCSVSTAGSPSKSGSANSRVAEPV